MLISSKIQDHIGNLVKNKLQNFCIEYSKLTSREIVYCDIGARFGLDYPWECTLNSLNTICFEPDSEEYERLKSKIKSPNKIFPYALSDTKGKSLLNLSKSRAASSLYEPNLELLKNFPEWERFTVEKQVEVETITFDEIYENNEIEEIDFIKVDVQGAELNILKGARKIINDFVIGIEAEVEFLEMYKDQPLFHDVNKYIITELGLELYDIKRYYWKSNEGLISQSGNGQLIFGDALYLRPAHNLFPWLAQFDDKKAKEKIYMAVQIGAMYGFLDYSFSIVNHSEIKKYLSSSQIDKIKLLLEKNCKKKTLIENGSYTISRFFYKLYKLFQSSHNGWTRVDPYLGSKETWGWW
jgi:FkbM family methyltransferase